MRIFIDLWINSSDTKLLRFLVKLGYRVAASTEIDKRVLEEEDLLLIRKTVVEASSRSELREKLRGIKNDYVIVSVKPISIDAARMAAHDSRVDTIIVDQDSLKYIDKAQMSLMKQFSKPLEIPFKTFLYASDRVKAMIYRRINYYLYYTKLPLIISSGASHWNELMEPRSTIYLFSKLFNIDEEKVLLYMTSYPREIIVRNGVSI